MCLIWKKYLFFPLLHHYVSISGLFHLETWHLFIFNICVLHKGKLACPLWTTGFSTMEPWGVQFGHLGCIILNYWGFPIVNFWGVCYGSWVVYYIDLGCLICPIWKRDLLFPLLHHYVFKNWFVSFGILGSFFFQYLCTPLRKTGLFTMEACCV